MTSAGRHPDRTPDVAALLERLLDHQVRFVLAGSVAAMAHGVEGIEPGDLDVVPQNEPSNLARLAALLHEVDARPKLCPGHWQRQAEGEWTWVDEDLTPEVQARFDHWSPNPADVRTFDHLFLTRLGNLDVVPAVSGSYERLMARAAERPLYGQVVPTAHVDDLLTGCTKPRRAKDAGRVRQLREIQFQQGGGRDN